MLLLLLAAFTTAQNVSIGFLGITSLSARSSELGYRFGILRAQEILLKYNVTVNPNILYHKLDNLDLTVQGIKMKDSDENLIACIGPLASTGTLGVATYFSALTNPVMLVSPSATSITLNAKGSIPALFRVIPPASLLASGIGDFAKKWNWNNVGK